MSYKLRIASLIGGIGIPCVFDKIYKTPKILFYHGVENNPIKDKRIQGNQMPFSVFKQQINYLKKKYTILSIDEFYDKVINNEKFYGNEIVITFDDGYRNNYTVVAPFLQSLDIPFTVFISTDNITTGKRLPTFYVRAAVYNEKIKKIDVSSLNQKFVFETEQDRLMAENTLIRFIKHASNENVKQLVEEMELLSKDQKNNYASEDLMNWTEVNEIINYGATIGSHCLDHAILHNQQTVQEIIRQLKESKDIICSQIGKCDYFAYPNGDIASVCDFSIEKVLDFYKMGFAANGKSIKRLTHKSYVSRIGVCGNYNAFKSQISILSNI